MDRTTRVSRHVRAPRGAVWRALVDPEALARWLPPPGLRGILHAFEPRVGGIVRMSLVYADPSAGPGGKSSADTDTFHGRIVGLVPMRRLALRTEFESEQPGMAGAMVVAFELDDAAEGTLVTCVCEGVPEGILLEDNETGSRLSLDNLAALVER